MKLIREGRARYPYLGTALGSLVCAKDRAKHTDPPFKARIRTAWKRRRSGNDHGTFDLVIYHEMNILFETEQDSMIVFLKLAFSGDWQIILDLSIDISKIKPESSHYLLIYFYHFR